MVRKAPCLSAAGPADYSSPSLAEQTLDFNPDALGSRVQCIEIEIASDFEVEGLEFFRVRIDNDTTEPLVIFENRRARVVITDTTCK